MNVVASVALGAVSAAAACAVGCASAADEASAPTEPGALGAWYLRKSASFETCLQSTAPDDAARWRRMRVTAFVSPDHTPALHDARGYLEGVSALHAVPCFDVLDEDVPVLNAIHCENGGELVDDAACLELAEIEISSRLGCHAYVRDLDDPYRVYRGAAHDTFGVWTRLGEPRAQRGRKLPGNVAELLATAAYLYHEGHEPEGLRRVFAAARAYGIDGPGLAGARRAWDK